jgi:hypothetical protein
MKLVSLNPEACLAAVRRLSENAINKHSRGLVTVKLTPLVAADAPDEDVEVFRFATFIKTQSAPTMQSAGPLAAEQVGGTTNQVNT